MSIESRIQAAAARNAELQHTLHETESAVPDLVAQGRYVADLQRQVDDAAAELRRLDARRRRELKEHESYRDSVMRRLAYKIGGRTDKFEARAAKEEREYFDVLREEHRADVAKRNLDAMLDDALAMRGRLEATVASHDTAQRELDCLYDSIFQGPSPGFPEEDKREREVAAAVRTYHDARQRAEGEAQAVAVLAKAQQRLNGALLSMEDALHASRMDVYGGGTFTDMMERNALSKAEMQVQEAHRLVAQARRLSPAVRPLPRVTIAQGDLLGDIFFDNIFSDMAFHKKIQQSNLEVQQCARALNSELHAAGERHAALTRETDLEAAALQAARTRLQLARAEAFESVAGRAGQTSSPTTDVSPPVGPPPSYTASDGPADDSWWES